MDNHARHGWAKVSIKDENNNRYQPNAPLVVWCGRCRRLLPADQAWAKLAAGGHRGQEKILLQKIAKWAGRSVNITNAKLDIRGRMELEIEDGQAPR